MPFDPRPQPGGAGEKCGSGEVISGDPECKAFERELLVHVRARLHAAPHFQQRSSMDRRREKRIGAAPCRRRPHRRGHSRAIVPRGCPRAQRDRCTPELLPAGGDRHRVAAREESVEIALESRTHLDQTALGQLDGADRRAGGQRKAPRPGPAPCPAAIRGRCRDPRRGSRSSGSGCGWSRGAARDSTRRGGTPSPPGGSSSVLRRVFAACRFICSAGSTTTTLRPPNRAVRPTAWMRSRT